MPVTFDDLLVSHKENIRDHPIVHVIDDKALTKDYRKCLKRYKRMTRNIMKDKSINSSLKHVAKLAYTCLKIWAYTTDTPFLEYKLIRIKADVSTVLSAYSILDRSWESVSRKFLNRIIKPIRLIGSIFSKHEKDDDHSKLMSALGTIICSCDKLSSKTVLKPLTETIDELITFDSYMYFKSKTDAENRLRMIRCKGDIFSIHEKKKMGVLNTTSIILLITVLNEDGQPKVDYLFFVKIDYISL